MDQNAFNEINRTLGSILSAQEHSTRSREAMWAELKAMRGDISELKDKVGRIGSLERRIADMEPELRMVNTLRNRGYGILVGVGLTGTAATYGVVQFVKDLLKSG